MTKHPYREAWALGSYPDIPYAAEQYFGLVVQSVEGITTRDLDRTKFVTLVSGGSVKFYEYDPTNVDAEDGVNVIWDSEDRPFVLRAGIGTGKRQSVRVATTANINLSSALENGDTLDGVTLAAGNLVLVKNQTIESQNGIYAAVASGAASRVAAFDTYDEHAGALIAVEEGTTNAATLWFCTANVGGALGTTDIEFTKINVTSDVPGPEGDPGADGTDPGILLTFDSDTADSNQGSGKVWLNNATLTSATVLYISKTNRAGSDIAAKLARLDDSSNPSPKAEGLLTRPSDGAQLTFAMGAVTDATGYVKIAISGVAGAASFTDADAISFQAERVGDAGSGLGNVVEDTTPQLGGTLDTNGKQIRWSKGADVASGSTLTLGDDGNYFDITGTTTITAIATKAAGTVVKLHFDAALTLTHNATDLILPGGANITTAAGDEAEFVEYATGDWRCTSYVKASGKPVVANTPTEVGAMGQGKHTIWVPAGAMRPRATNGCAALAVVTLANTHDFPHLAFDGASAEVATFIIQMPKGWNESTISFRPVWSHPSTATNFGVLFGIRGRAVSDGEAMNFTAITTGANSVDTGGTTDYIYIGPESSAYTIEGSPAEGDLVLFEVYRAPADGSDTLAVDARLHGIHLYYTTNAATDA